MLLRYVEIAAAATGAVFALIMLVVTIRYRREIIAAEKRKAVMKLRAIQSNRGEGSQIGMKEADSEQQLVGVK